MDRVLTKAEIEAQLRSKSDAISRRVEALEQEVATTGDALKEAIFNHPLVSVGGAIAAGLLVGLIFGGRGRAARGRGTDLAHRTLVDAYLDAVVAEVRDRTAHGAEADEAVRKALQDRVPLIVHSSMPERPGFLAQALDLTLKTAFGFGVKAVLDLLARRIDLEDFIEPQTPEETLEDAVPVAAAVSETDDRTDTGP